MFHKRYSCNLIYPIKLKLSLN